ncbi:MAG: hypothetical protein HDR10_03785 [Lachnospiraceae bacterium]|nr:hypothetical protein [Lachnospiraceae bacterium]
MSVNGVTGTSDVYSAYSTASTKTTSAETKAETTSESKSTSAGAVYEPSSSAKAASANKTYKVDTQTIAKMKADAESRTSQLKSLVQQMMTKQGQTYGKANDIWSFLAGGNFTVDPATKAQAQADIAEDGYWGVNQTSQRILDFATALTGGDPSQIEKMRSAFEKGYKLAAEKWGGNLPDISQKTYDAVMSGFDKMKQDAGIEE